ncbi:proline-rich protein 11 isoform X3 [Mobula hypostoma]|uniref:proline-rich protein 11 isoform X3 n=1 Tax=Mobula hypostoma TaxID=723540 RepID=UPI002FC2D65E
MKVMFKLNWRRRKRKIMRKWQAIGRAQRKNKQTMLRKYKGDICKPKPTTCQTTEKEDVVASNSNSFLHESVPVGLIPLANVKNFLNPLKTVVYSMYSWWLKNIRQGLEFIKDTLYPSRVYLRELNALRQQIESLEIKLTRMQEIFEHHQDPNTAKAAEGCCCRKHADSVPGLNKIPVWPVQPIVSRALLKISDEALPLLPPPPPPPPPLPPAFLLAEKPLQIKRKSRTENPQQTIHEEIRKSLSITTKDLLQVKLKSTADRFEVTKMDTPGKKRSPLVTLSDLQGFNFQGNANQLQKPTKMMITPHRPVLDLRQRLKKVNIERSPGGTPLHKENKDTATGLTPVMTQALRRKFEMAHPKSPPGGCSSSNTSFDEQSAC